MSITPELAGGFRDYLPADMIPRQRMLATIQSVFERFGFVPIKTPAIEKEEVLTGGDPSFKMHIFRIGKRASFKVSANEEELALRFDHTVPLARFIAEHRPSMPFKRYVMGDVWRAEKPQAGRFREFGQCDADIAGSASMMADAEIVAVMYDTMMALGIKNFLIRVNNRKILNGLAAYAGFSPEKTADALRVIDKLDKQGWDAVSTELGETYDFTSEQIEAIKRFVELRGNDVEETLEAVAQLMAKSPIALEGVAELREVAVNVTALNIPADKWTVDISVARGLGYYTGPVFETVLTDLPSIGSVFSGGRFDGLVSRFSDMNVPATGASIGIDRLFVALEKLELIVKQGRTADVMILNFERSCEVACQRVATALRFSGIPTEIYIGPEKVFKGQFAYAVKGGYPVVVIIGGQELEKGVVQVKDMNRRIQEEVPETDAVYAVKKVLTQPTV